MISQLISGYLFSTTTSALTGMEKHVTDLATCEKGAFKPCECKMCFFCVKGLTNGILHRPSKGKKVIVEYKCRTHVTANKCTNVRVSLGLSSGEYCRMCYRKQLTTEMSAKDRQQRCRTSAMGCPICKEPICKECWKEGYDKHA